MRIIEQLNLKKKTFRSQQQRKIVLRLASRTSNVTRSSIYSINNCILTFLFFLPGKYAKALQSEREFKESWILLQQKMTFLNMNPVDKKMIEHDVMRQQFE